MIKQFSTDVAFGLNQTQKSISSKYFYNKRGDELFVEIMRMPEYYLTRAEMEIFTHQTDDIIKAFDLNQEQYFDLIELGAGDGSKTTKLLQALNRGGFQYAYMPVDISQNALDTLEASLAKKVPEVEVKKQQGDYFAILNSLKQTRHPKIVLFLGSNIGNMTDEVATSFISQLANNLSQNDKLLIGADLIKPADVVLPAYNDSNGITREFNLNLLRRINDELGADFDLTAFDHAPEYKEEEGVAKSYLKSLQQQQVQIDAIGETFEFAAGEKIYTEISRKYNDQILQQIIAPTAFEITHKLTDNREYFADYILKRS